LQSLNPLCFFFFIMLVPFLDARAQGEIGEGPQVLFQRRFVSFFQLFLRRSPLKIFSELCLFFFLRDFRQGGVPWSLLSFISPSRSLSRSSFPSDCFLTFLHKSCWLPLPDGKICFLFFGFFSFSFSILFRCLFFFVRRSLGCVIYRSLPTTR